jgi:hypothetical protein
MSYEEFAPSTARRERAIARMAKYIREGRDYVTLVAEVNLISTHETISDEELDNSPYVQFAWRDDLRLQIETQGDQFRHKPYEPSERRMLLDLGYSPPFSLGEEFSNWTILRRGEGCHPESAATCMINTLWWVHWTNFHSFALSRRLGIAHYHYDWNVTPSRRDIAGETQKRYGVNPQ